MLLILCWLNRSRLKFSKNLKAVIRIMVVLLVLGTLLMAKVDLTPYHQMEFYHQTLAHKDSLANQLHTQTQTQTLSAGWGIASITPMEPVRLTGKNFKPYQQVFDSVYVRTILFDNGVNRVLMANYDLWIMHPVMASAVREMINEKYPEINGIYFTANHSHTSIGGWASGLLGALIIGGNHPKTIDYIVDQTSLAIDLAQQRLDTVSIGFGAVETEGMVMNRLDTNARLDNRLRILKTVDAQGRTGLFSTYSAHSVYMNKDINTLSADYPGPYLEILGQYDKVDYTAFAPGATGSHTPIGRKPFEHSKMLNYASQLAQYAQELQGQIETEDTGIIQFMEWPVELRSAHFRIGNYWRLRPWVFDMVMGKPSASITVLRIGNIVMVGLPVELSGEYYSELEQAYQKHGLSLMITTFNGWYLGYVNPERYYFTLKRAETREMNWFGYQNGEYFAELIKLIPEMLE